MNESASNRKKTSRGWYWLLLVPFIGTLWPPFFASETPTLGGFPFFYWYLFLWVIISALLTFFVYWMTRDR
ncbi:MAG: DUF3311 domain-containing protein [Firmicutes bacterium]|nr:DUF3311 domain-containing protein [Bacillota bacterium]